MIEAKRPLAPPDRKKYVSILANKESYGGRLGQLIGHLLETTPRNPLAREEFIEIVAINPREIKPKNLSNRLTEARKAVSVFDGKIEHRTENTAERLHKKEGYYLSLPEDDEELTPSPAVSTILVADINRHSKPPLSREIEKSLFTQYRSLSSKEEKQKLKGEIASHYYPYVAKLARNFSEFNNVPYEDLFQEGAIGLLKSIDSFDPANNTTFLTYAGRTIIREIIHAINSNYLIRLPHYLFEEDINEKGKNPILAVTRARNIFLKKHRREPSLEELEEKTKIDLPKIKEVIDQLKFQIVPLEPKPLSEFSEIGDDEREEPIDSIANLVSDPNTDWEQIVNDISLDVALTEALRQLPSRQRGILKAHHGIGIPSMSLAQIAKTENITFQAIEIAENKALKELRDNERTRELLEGHTA